MKMTHKVLLPFFAVALLLFTAGCGEDVDPLIENEEEVITAVTLTFFPDGTQETVTLGFSDPDGDGGNAPMMSQTGDFVANSVYSAQVSFGNDTGSIDAEIAAEDTDHQVFYVKSSGLNLSTNYQDTDRNGNPLGLRTQMLTGDPSSGQLTVILRHEPDKAAMALPENPELAGGETDVEVVFDVTIQ